MKLQKSFADFCSLDNIQVLLLSTHKNTTAMKILNEKQIEQKIQRLAIEILENNYEEEEIIMIGINNRGWEVAGRLTRKIQERSKLKVRMTRLRLSPAAPLDHPIELEMPAEEMAGKVVIIADDVANTGRTLFYAFRPLMNVLFKKVEVVVLVDRKHKSFPIKVDYVGLSLATTLMENIDVHILEGEEQAIFLN